MAPRRPKGAPRRTKRPPRRHKNRPGSKNVQKPCVLRVEFGPSGTEVQAPRGRDGGIGEASGGRFGGGTELKFEILDFLVSHALQPHKGAGGFKRSAPSAVPL